MWRLAALVAVAAASANSTFTVTGGPTGDVMLTPGKPSAAVYTVVNEGDAPADFRVRVTGLHFNGTAPQFSGDPSPGLTVTASPQQLTLAPRTDGRVEVTMQVPDGAPAGGRYAGLIFEEVPPASQGASTVVAAQARPLIGRVPGDTTDTGRIESFLAQRVAVDNPSFTLRFVDTGTIHYPLDGTVTLRNGSNVVGTVNVPQQLVIPGESRTLEIVYAGTVPLGKLDADLALRWGTSAEHSGEAHVSAVVGTKPSFPNGGRPDSQVTLKPADRRWIPETVASLLLLLVLLLFAALALRRRRGGI